MAGAAAADLHADYILLTHAHACLHEVGQEFAPKAHRPTPGSADVLAVLSGSA